MESFYWNDVSYITLTYDEEHIPSDHSLNRVDYQKFLKRLRRRIEPRKMKYFLCGEYGGLYGRCHYHAILFGINPISDRKVIEECWPFGYVKFAPFCPKSCAYVCGYVSKKITDYHSDDWYERQGFKAPFMVASQRLGDAFIHDHFELCNDDGFKFMNTRYPMSKRHYSLILQDMFEGDDLGAMVEKIGKTYESSIDKLKNSQKYASEAEVTEKILISKFNNFKQPSERKRWRD